MKKLAQQSQLSSMTKTLRSFDVFDTLVTRSVGSPHGLFLLLGIRLYRSRKTNLPPEVFARQRHHAEQRAFANRGGLDSDVGVYEIYRELAHAFRLDMESVHPWLAEELALERELIREVEKGKQLLKTARENYSKIAFLSDMYLSRQQLEYIMGPIVPWQQGELVLISSECSKSKVSGGLFKLLMKEASVGPEKITHCGNHFWSDVHSPKSMGLRTDPMLDANLNIYEQIFDNAMWESHGVGTLVAGASRLARLRIEARNQSERSLRDITASVVAPQLVDFVNWTLSEAIRRGLKRIYYLSRDGQVLKLLAEKIKSARGLDIDLRYLYTGRQAWVLPSLTEITYRTIEAFLPSRFDVEKLSIRMVCSRLELSPGDIAKELDSVGFTESSWDRSLDEAEKARLRTLIVESGSIREKFLASAARAREILVQYLDQEGLMEGEYAIVDNGTGATLHNALSAVLVSIGRPPPVSLYHGRRSGVVDIGHGLPDVYLNNSESRTGYFNLPGLNTLMEIVCIADHGTVIGYRKCPGGKISPLLARYDSSRAENWGHDVVRRTLLAYVDVMQWSWYESAPALGTAFEQVQNLFWRNPNPIDARIWGSFPFEDGWGNETFSVVLARPYRLRDLLRPLKNGMVHDNRHWWHDGAFSQSSKPIRGMYTIMLRIGRKLRRLLGAQP
ncbi:MAG: hypothetical protein ACK58U_19240 [Rubrivivax sp.]|jgi:FMN phosphatase YigB (HAD superfamily)